MFLYTMYWLIGSIIITLQFEYGNAVNDVSKSIRAQASKLVQDNRFDEAIQLLKRSLIYDRNIDTCNDLAKLYLQTQQYDQAYYITSKCLKIKSSSVDAHVNLGYYYQAINQSLTAKNAFRDALIHKALQDHVFGLNLCQLLISFKNYKLCQHIAAKKTEQFNNQNPSEFRISHKYGGIIDEAQITIHNVYDKYLYQFSNYVNTTIHITMDVDRNIIRSYYLLLGFCDFKLRNFASSIHMYKYVKGLVAFQQWRHAANHVHSKHHDQASMKTELQKFVSLIKCQIEAEYYIALCYFHLQQYNRSNNVLKKIDQKAQSKLKIVGPAYSSLSDDLKNKLFQLSKALHRINQVNVWINIGYLNALHVETSRNFNTTAIISHLRHVLKLIPDFQPAYSILGEIYMKIRHLNAGINCLTHAIELNQHDVHTLRLMGSAMSQAGNLDEAIYYYNQSLIIEPGSMDTLRTMGQILMKQENFHPAMTYLGKFVQVALKKLDAESKLGIMSDKPTQIYHVLQQMKPHANQNGLHWIDIRQRIVNRHLFEQL